MSTTLGKETWYCCSLYVDDVYFIGNHISKLEWLHSKIKTQFEMNDLKLLQHSLGIEYLFHSSGKIVTQRSYVVQMLTKFGILHCNGKVVPMHPRLKLKVDMATPLIYAQLYQHMVGKIIFLTQTRPDIAFIVNMVNCFSH
jgi:hypothetical protein